KPERLSGGIVRRTRSAMRIPLDKVYRAFPELDAFSDAGCDRFVERAAQDYAGARAAAHFIGVCVIVAGLVGIGILERVFWDGIGQDWSVLKRGDVAA